MISRTRLSYSIIDIKILFKNVKKSELNLFNIYLIFYYISINYEFFLKIHVLIFELFANTNY